MKRGIFILGTIGLIFSSCIKHEVIPAPVPMVDLYAHFTGTVDGASIDLTENVLEYSNTSEVAKIILPPPNFSSAVYYSQLASPSVGTSIKVGLGSMNWDASLASSPSLTTFNAFFSANDIPAYSDNGLTGFEVTYRDAFGTEWKSSQASLNLQDVTFTNIVQESDSTGDYSLFTCNFNCYAYNAALDDSIKIEDGIYHGWFKR